MSQVEFDVIASLVTFNNDLKVLKTTIESFLDTSLRVKLVIVDNSSNKAIKSLASELEVDYIEPGGNIGFGKAHNIAINKFASQSKYFLILNPDVELNQTTLSKLNDFLDTNSNVVLTSSKVLNPDGSLQRVHKRLPSFQVIFARRFLPSFLKNFLKKELGRYIISEHNFENPLKVPSVSGCFMLFRSNHLINIRGFDERFFMYFEDIDISRRSCHYGDVVIYPESTIKHLWAKGSYKSLKLTFINISSALKYFVKWMFKSRSHKRYEVKEYHLR